MRDTNLIEVDEKSGNIHDIVNYSAKSAEQFRNYDENLQTAKVRKTYEEMHEKQTVEFVDQQRAKWLQFNHSQMGILEALMLLNNFVDESDPDIDLPNSVHAFQTAERIRAKHPDKDWFQLTGLIHDLGKVMGLWGEPQWCVVGDTFPVGCKFQETCVFYESFIKNPDYSNPNYNSLNGIYTEGCGLDQVLLSWGHDEYMYQVLVENKCKLPEEALHIIRYHSFYPYHTEKSYKNLCNDKDHNMLPWLEEFNTFDLYSKSDDIPDIETLTPYYQSLIEKYVPGNIRF